MYYIYEKTSDDFIYSIDNLRICFNLNDNYEIFLNKLEPYYVDCEDLDFKCKYYHSTKFYAFEHLFTFNSFDKSRSFTIGFSQKGRHKFQYDGFIDFNPNKVGDWLFFNMFYDLFLQYASDLFLRRYDLAIDLPFKRLDVKLIKDRRSYHYLKDKSVTEYLGKRSNHNYIKLYDKKVESKLDYDLTRVEITVDPEHEIVFPEIKIKSFKDGLSLSDLPDTHRVLLQLLDTVEDPFYYINQLGRRMKNQFEEYLKYDYIDFKFEAIVMYRLIDDVKNKYFNGNLQTYQEINVDIPWKE